MEGGEGAQQKGWGVSSKTWVTVANKEQWISHFPNFCYTHIMSTQCCRYVQSG